MKYIVKLAKQVDVIATVEIEAGSEEEASTIALARDENDDVGEYEISWESATEAESFDVQPVCCTCDIPEPNENDFCGTCGLPIEGED